MENLLVRRYRDELPISDTEMNFRSAILELQIGDSKINFRFDVSNHRTKRREQKKGEKKTDEPNFYRSVMVERKLKGVWERERWQCEAEKSKREKKRVWESGDGEAKKEWMNVKDEVIF